jgi:predicted AAA+ superfamily ATPase
MANLTLKRFEQEKELILAQMRAEALPFEDDSPLAKRERKERTRYDVLEFAKTYMPHYVPGEYSEYHEELKDYTNTENEPIFFSGPKGTGKSVLVTIVDYVRRSVNKLNHFMIILGQTEDQASDRAAYIQFEIENNPRIKQDFGDLRGSWLW